MNYLFSISIDTYEGFTPNKNSSSNSVAATPPFKPIYDVIVSQPITLHLKKNQPITISQTNQNTI